MNDSVQIKTEILAAKETATYLNISYWKLLDMVRRKQIPHFRAGSRLLFRVDTLVEWMRNQETASMQQQEINRLEPVKLRRIQ